MKDDHHSGEFNHDYIGQFEGIQKRALEIPYVKDSIEYLLTMVYGFENYIVEKIAERDKTGLLLKKIETDASGGSNVFLILERIKEFEEHLTIQERLFIIKIKNLIELQIKKLRLHTVFPENHIRNKTLFLLDEKPGQDEVIKKERIVWLAGREKAELLVTQLQKNNFIDATDANICLSIFCGKEGELFTSENPVKVKWNGKNSELTYLIRKLSGGSGKFITDDEVWVKVSKWFLDKNGKELKPNSLSVSSQKGNPKSKAVIDAIVKDLSRVNE